MKKAHIALLIGVAIIFVWSGINPYDRLTWWLEVFPGIAGIIILAATYRRFQFTTLVYTLIAIHICILCVGGHWTYAREPVFNWLGCGSVVGRTRDLGHHEARRARRPFSVRALARLFLLKTAGYSGCMLKFASTMAPFGTVPFETDCVWKFVACASMDVLAPA